MGCQCAKTVEESKSELVNTNTKDFILKNFTKEDKNQNILKISVSDSGNTNILQSLPSQANQINYSNIERFSKNF